MKSLARKHPALHRATASDARGEDRDWTAVMSDLIHGRGEDRELALWRLNRLLSGFLEHLGAWKYRDDWGDLRQTVLLKLLRVVRSGGLRDAKAFVGYARVVTQNVYYDLLRARQREASIELPETVHIETPDPAIRAALRTALERLTERVRRSIWAVYVERHTYEEASVKLDIPLGTLKHDLQTGLRDLRKYLNDDTPLK